MHQPPCIFLIFALHKFKTRKRVKKSINFEVALAAEREGA